MKTLIFAPHPDDETIGVGGTILKRLENGDKVAWVIVTALGSEHYTINKINNRKKQIKQVHAAFKFSKVFELNFTASMLDAIPIIKLYKKISETIKDFKPDEIFIPHPSDSHSDHQAVFKAVSSCTKTFRYPYIKKILCYETLSETGYGLNTKNGTKSFEPNYYVDISKFMKKKTKIARIYSDEFKKHPFPRSIKSIISNGLIRGAEANYTFAECFELLRFIED